MEPLIRQEILQVLSAMGIYMPPGTKLPDEALSTRLDLALKSSQELPVVLPSPSSTTLEISSLENWPSNRLGNVQGAMYRANMAETSQVAALKQAGVERPTFGDVGDDVVYELRQSILSLGKSWDEHIPCVIVQDPDHNEAAVNIRILEVKRINDKTPAIVVLYAGFTKVNPMPGLRWVQEKMKTPLGVRTGRGAFTNTKASIIEQKTLLRILDANSAYVPSTYRPERTPTEGDFKVSFVFPFGPLSFDALGKLNLDTGCAVCGEKSMKKCSSCLSIEYCGRECQVGDWPTHKSNCKSVKGGAWRTIKLSVCLPGFEDMYMARINRHASASSPNVEKPDPNKPPPNIHGNRIFLIKIQLAKLLDDPLSEKPLPQHMLIYDRKRSAQWYFVQTNETAALFEEFKHEMKMTSVGPPHALKIYRYARRVSDWELSVCLDKPPQTAIKW